MTPLVQENPILGIDEPTITAYFAALNDERYEAVAALFAEQGVLYPPFEEAVVGRGAIARYLSVEAVGLRVEPRKGECLSTEDNERCYRLVGKAKLPLFSVNVAWQFGLNTEDQITFVTVDLLATLEELLNYQPLRQQR
ncbi:nuclear transport factor 2 family protein [Thermosynechococcus sp. HN-54]|uniref:nuclear transport factor 2 family protein n=1 Tax=Thermosynechococcus sp. HN-54 TaxID=2933959 RepID=UPI00202CCB4A|nr:nuclear transport factor 2 family protein [Thermosynechococcus sp. HN-54]URR35854.1 nuclear transport factor 2 family protein [Thermosynechococcus sp. HN-54]